MPSLVPAIWPDTAAAAAADDTGAHGDDDDGQDWQLPAPVLGGRGIPVDGRARRGDWQR